MGVGTGTTITFGTSGFTANFHIINAGERTRDAVPTSHLGTTGARTSIPAQTYEPGQITGTFEWDQSFSTFPPITAAAETITITFPLKSGETSNATLAGTGFLVRDAGPNVELDTLMMGEMTIQWDGATDPVFTAGSS